MNHWIVVPVVLPALAAVALLVLERTGSRWTGAVNLAVTAAVVGVAARLLAGAADGSVAAYLVGNWPPPFGIVLAVDRLAALMLMLASLVALAALLYALTGAWADATHFHPLLQLQLMGLNGAFLTADLFNLFVFFEVLLIASYGLLLHAPDGRRVAAGLHYVILNLVGSSLFLVGVSLLYAVAGTLNLADLAGKVAALDPSDAAIARSAAMLLLVVFGLKAALLPLYFWLPGTYAAAPGPVGAVFAIMTKVGVYAIVRVFTLVFGAGAGLAANVAVPLLLPVALATLVVASLGALAATRLGELAAWLVAASAGTLLTAVGLASSDGLAGALYYAAHSTLVGAALFLVADLVRDQRGPQEDLLQAGTPVAQPVWVGIAYFVAAVALAGLPPLSGFVGKLIVLDAAVSVERTLPVFAVVLGAGLLTVTAMTRAGSRLFWNIPTEPTEDGRLVPIASPGKPAPLARLFPVFALLAGSVALSLLAAPVRAYAVAAAEQLHAPQDYLRSVLAARPVPRGQAK